MDDYEIDEDEFKQVLETLAVSTFGRVVTQVGLTILCPVSASYICSGLQWAVMAVMSGLELSAPASVKALGASLPPSLDETLLTGILMLSISPAVPHTEP